MTETYDISAIENVFKGIVKDSGVAATVYTSRPKATVTKDSFAVVRIVGALSDLETHGKCRLDIDLFAKDVQNEKNGAKLAFMYGKIVSAMPPYAEGIYIDTAAKILGDVPDDFGFHARIIQFNLTIKSI